LPTTPPFAWNAATLQPRLTVLFGFRTTFTAALSGLVKAAPLALTATIVLATSPPAAGRAKFPDGTDALVSVAATESVRVLEAGDPVM
jgi:hypothetical protein